MIPTIYNAQAYSNTSGAKKGTADTNRIVVQRYTAWLKLRNLDLESATDRDALQFETFLQRDEGLATSTIQSYMRNLHRYLSWLATNGVIKNEPQFRVQSRPRVWATPSTLTIEQMRIVLENARDDRAWCLMAVLAFTGVKSVDILNCSVSDLSTQGDQTTLYLQRSQGRLPFTVLHPIVAERLHSYIGDRRSGPLFLNREGRRLGRSAAGGILLTTTRRANLPFVLTLNHLYYFLSLHSLEEGFSYRSVIRAIGIVQPNQTTRWLQTMSHEDPSHASVRMSRLVLVPPETTESLLGLAGASLDETDLPEAFAIGAIGAIVERHLRQMCVKANLDIPPDPKKGSIAKYVAILHENQELSLHERQQCEQLQEWRNQAAHGNYESLSVGDAARALKSALDLTTKHPL